MKCKDEYTRGFNDALAGINTEYKFHTHSHSENSGTMTFNSVADATSYFRSNTCADTSPSGGGCFASYHPAHEHNSSCYVQTICGRWQLKVSVAMGDGTAHFKCDGCGQMMYTQGHQALDDPNHYKNVAACGLSTTPYYSTTCGYQHGELISATISF